MWTSQKILTILNESYRSVPQNNKRKVTNRQLPNANSTTQASSSATQASSSATQASSSATQASSSATQASSSATQASGSSTNDQSQPVTIKTVKEEWNTGIIGQGSFGYVFKFPEKYAIKLTVHDENEFNIYGYLKLLKEKSPNVLEAFACSGLLQNPNRNKPNLSHSFIVMDYVTYGSTHLDLFDFVNKVPDFKKRIKHILHNNFVKQLFDGMDYLHRNGIVHADIKLENILLSGNSNNTVLKYTDFGLSFETGTDDANEPIPDTSIPFNGTLMYFSPTTTVKNTLDRKHALMLSDYWALSILIDTLYNMEKCWNTTMLQHKDSNYLLWYKYGRKLHVTWKLLPSTEYGNYTVISLESLTNVSKKEMWQQLFTTRLDHGKLSLTYRDMYNLSNDLNFSIDALKNIAINVNNNHIIPDPVGVLETVHSDGTKTIERNIPSLEVFLKRHNNDVYFYNLLNNNTIDRSKGTFLEFPLRVLAHIVGKTPHSLTEDYNYTLQKVKHAYTSYSSLLL